MALITGAGEFVFEVVDGWARIPGDLDLQDVADVGIDDAGHRYLFSRGAGQVIVLDGEGSFLRRWGDRETYPYAHAVTMGPDQSIWLTDSFDHTVRKCSLNGDVLMKLGTSGSPAPPMSGRAFNGCTHVAIHPRSDELYVSDGYGNAAIHRFTPDGERIGSWGRPGNQPGEFNLPHNLCIDGDGFVYVADRHNQRVQVFSSEGTLEHIWHNMALPCGMHLDLRRSPPVVYVAELSSAMWAVGSEFWDPWNTPGMGPRVSIYSLQGDCLAILCDEGAGNAPGQLSYPHGLAVDADGNIFIAMLAGPTDRVSLPAVNVTMLRPV